jgi:hypothetical protein
VAPERHEVWREHYRLDRYMHHLDQAGLDQRMKHVFANLSVLTQEGKIGLPPISEEGERWMILWTHLLEEYGLRSVSIPADLTSMREIPDPDLPRTQSAARTVRGRGLQPGSYLFKFGKAEHLTQLLERGEILVRQASYYNDPALNHAVHDDELSIVLQPNPGHIRLTVFDQVTGEKKGELYPSHNKIEKKLETDYYVYCLSQSFKPRLFLDFDSDACLIFHNPETFVERLTLAMESALPGWTAAGVGVNYIDPLRTLLSGVDLFRAKHFKFSYQKEFRVVCLPPAQLTGLGPIKLTVPSLGESCELIKLGT